MKLAFLLSFVFYIANCTLSVRTNSHSSPGTEIDLPAKIKVKVIVSGDTDSGLAETLKDKLSDHPKIESVEVISDSADIYNTGDHKNTLVVRFQNKGVGSDVNGYTAFLGIITLGVFPIVETEKFPVALQFYDEKGDSKYLQSEQPVKETSFRSWLAMPLFIFDYILPKATPKVLALSGIYSFLDKETNSKLSKNVASTERLVYNPKIQAAVDEWKKEFAWREKLSKEEASKIKEMESNSLEDYLKADKTGSYASYLALEKFAGLKMKSGDFSGAANAWKTYQNQFPNKKSEIQELISILGEKENGQIKNIGSDINSSVKEYTPIPEVSGRKMYFTSNGRSGGSGNEDLWESSLNEQTNSWYNTKPISELNDSGNQAPLAVSPDGTEIFIFGHYTGALGGGDIFQSKLGSNGWQETTHLNRPINSEYFDSDIGFSSEGKAVLFVTDRPGGYFPLNLKNKYHAGDYWGNTDIYVSFKNEDGSYTSPRNLGPFINTPGAERMPFLHPDGKTLYFSSNGHNGFGDLDIFKTVRLDDTWQNWSKPVNLGKSLNGSGTDWGFKMTAASKSGFFAAELKDSLGGSDLYEIIPLPERAKPAGEVVGIYGKIVDQNGNPAEARVVWQDLKTGKTIGQLMSKATTGEFYITLPVGGQYAYFATIKGFLNQSQKIDLSKDKKFREVNFEMKLVSIDSAISQGTEITLNNITFEAGKDVLRSESFAEIDSLVKVMIDSPKIKMEIQGHTSAEPGVKEEINLDLSNRRAKSVSDYLLSKGVPVNRLRSNGYGSSKPTAPNDKEENRIKNRRVSFIVLKD